MAELRKYATATTIYFPLIGRDTNDVKTSATLASGDFKISIDGGAFANTATATPTDEGQGWYSLPLTSGETTGKCMLIACIDQTATKNWEDQMILIETYGHASAQHPFDLGTASVAQTGDSYARLGAPAGASVSADIAAIEAQTDDIGAAGAGLTAVPWNAAWDAEVQSEVADALAVYDPPTHTELIAEIDAVQTDVAGVQSDTNDIQTRLPAALVSGRIDASVGAVAANAITAASIATGAVDADALAADAVTEIAAGISIPSAATIADAVWDEAQAGHVSAGTFGLYLDTEVSGVGGGSLTETGIADAILSRPISNVEGSAAFRTLAGAIAKLVNKITIDGSTLRIKKTDDATDFGTQTMTTDGSAEPVVTLDTD